MRMYRSSHRVASGERPIETPLQTSGRVANNRKTHMHTDTHLQQVRPLPGKCIIKLDPLPDKIGSLFIPDSARDMKPTEPLHTGVVVSMSTRKYKPGTSKLYKYEFQEEFQVGDRVLIALTLEDLNRGYVDTLNTRVYAVVGDSVDCG